MAVVEVIFIGLCNFAGWCAIGVGVMGFVRTIIADVRSPGGADRSAVVPASVVLGLGIALVIVAAQVSRLLTFCR